MRLRLLMLLGLVVFVTSCRKGIDNDSEVSDMTLTLLPTIYGQKAPSAADERSLTDVMAAPGRIVADAIAKSGGVATRALEPSFTKSKWVNGDKFSMFLTVESDGKATPISFVGNVYNSMRYDNLTYTYNGTQFSASGKLYYPYRRAAVDLYGIYPYDAELGQDAAANVGGSKRDKSNPSGYLWNVFERQDIQGGFTGSGNKTVNQKFNVEQADLLYSTSTGVLPNNEGLAQPLVFKHLMSKVFVKLLVPTEFNGNILDVDAPITSAKLLNTYLEGLVDFRADSVYVKPAESATPITMRPCGSVIPAADEGVEGTYYYYECVAVPQSVESGKNFFQIQVKYSDGSGASFIMRLDKGMGLYSGREHTLDFVFDSKVGLRLNGSYIKDWIEGDGGGGLVGPSNASPAANSYVVSPGDELLLNSFLAGNDVAGISSYSQKLRSGVKSVKLLWQTKAGHVSSGPLLISSIEATKLDLVRIKTNSAAIAGGNAVVAAYSGVDGTGEILWSWHIWVTPQKIDLQTYGDKFVASNGNGNAIMDRNLGALSATGADGSVKTGGLLYQWGRKDAFTGVSDGGASAIEVYDIAGTVTSAGMGSAISGDNSFKFLTSDGDNLAGSIANPMTFYYANSTSGNWTNPKIDGLWSNYGTHKSLFDPCPSGYRVASEDSWLDISDQKSGPFGVLEGSGANMVRIHPELGGAPVFAFCGTRAKATGQLGGAASYYNIHTGGTFSGTDLSYCYASNNGTVYIKGESWKADGVSVRCVQDEGNDEHLTVLAQKSIPASGGRANVKVYANRGGAWSATVTGGAGFSLSSSSGSGNGSFDVIATSAGTVGRTATVTVKNAFGTLVRTAKITQVPATVVIAGTEWCSFNLTGDDGQSTAVKLTTEPQEYGKFFKWGDAWVYQCASSSTDGDWTTVTSGSSTVPSVSYTGGVGNDYIFGLSGGRASGDPCQKLGAEYHTPTRAQWQAVYGTGSKWDTYQGVKGMFLGAKVQTCDNETIQDGCIFLPAAGYRRYDNGSQDDQSSWGHYWSSSVGNSSNGWNCRFNSSSVDPDNGSVRGNGLSVRCVRSTAPQLALSAIAPGEIVPREGKTYTIAVGATGAWSTSEATAGVTVTPSSGTGTNLAVKITIAANTGTGRDVSVKFNTTSGTPAQSITWSGAQDAAFVPPTTVTIAGTKWTTANLSGVVGSITGHGVTAYPADYGMFFKWGSKYTYGRISSNSDGDGWGGETQGSSTTPTSQSMGYDYVNLNGKWPGDPCQSLGLTYKTPTQTQWAELNNVGRSWKTYRGVNGYFFGSNHASCTDTSIASGCIFLPAAGLRFFNSGDFGSQDSSGYYNASSVCSPNSSWDCYFFSSDVSTSNNAFRGYGMSVRCIQE